MVDPGKLRKRLDYKVVTRTTDAQGGYTNETYTHSRYLWGDIQPTAGSKRWEAQQVIHGVTHTITTYWFSTYTSDAVFTYGDRTFVVKGVTNVNEADEELVWLCEEKKL